MNRSAARQARPGTLSEGFRDFIDEELFHRLLTGGEPDPARVREVLAKSLAKEALEPAETAQLLCCREPGLGEEIEEAARLLKRKVYGNRIVLFAPLYIGNKCINDCAYCGFRRSNRDVVRRTLDREQLTAEVKALEDAGHKRLILVFGEHPEYSPEYIADTVRRVYSVRSGRGEIRRVNINAAPFDREGFRTVKAAGIGTYQVFMETYHHETYRHCHPAGTVKGDYAWRLDALSRAFEAGCDDMGLGVLFGLQDWRFEVLGLVAHSRHLQERYGVGPHTLSFPRLKPAHRVALDEKHLVGDADFRRLIAVLRLAVPYTGLILTAREKPELRRRVMEFGVSQIDAGSRIELGAYAGGSCAGVERPEQFHLGDRRSLDEVMGELLEEGFLPSFCTACYRLGRTGEHFMEFAIPGFIKNYCTPNGLTTLLEYLVDYAGTETRKAGTRLIEEELDRMPEGNLKRELIDRLERIRTQGERDLYF